MCIFIVFSNIYTCIKLSNLKPSVGYDVDSHSACSDLVRPATTVFVNASSVRLLLAQGTWFVAGQTS